MKHNYQDVEVCTEDGETFFLNITIDVIAYPLEAKLHGPPETCDEGEPGEYDVEWCLSPCHHPTLLRFTIPGLDAILAQCAEDWAYVEVDKIWIEARR